MNFSLIAFLLGRLSLALSTILLLPIGVAIFYNDGSYTEFAITSFTAFFIGLGFIQYGKFDEKEDISLREGFATVVFSWLLTCIICALPYIFLQILDPISAIFESMSGLTTTGATVITNLAAVPKTVLFWRSFTHWLGGIGIIVLFIALLPQVAGGAVHLFNAEVSGFGTERLLPRIRTTAGALFFIYCLFTVIGTGFLVIFGMSNFDAINHSMSAIATGGFSTYDNSVMHYNSVSIEVVLSLIMFLGGGNFALYYAVTQRGFKTLWRDSEFKAYMMLIVVLTMLITLNLFFVTNLQFFEGLRCAFFQVVSFATTTGYVSYDYDNWPTFSKLLLALLYLIGACAGSTAGGIKVGRFIVMTRAVFSDLRRAIHPQMLLTVSFNGKIMPISVVAAISRFIFVYIMTIAVMSLLLTATGVDIQESIFAVSSCLSSVGPAFGSLGATGNYAEINGFGKIVLGLTMLLGRLELFTMLALLRSEFWSSNRNW